MDDNQQSSVFFAVYVPTSIDDDTSSSIGMVFERRDEAVEFWRRKEFKDRGARFNSFRNLTDAERFASSGCGNTNNSSTTPCSSLITSPPSPFDEPSIPFPSISRPQMNIFKRTIESHNNQQFDQLIMDNPRYLINCSGDVPAIVVEGSRYNAMHVAIRSGNDYVVRRIIDIMSDNNCTILQQLYPGDSSNTNTNRRLHLLNAYVNMPDKSANETPLHLATKFGHVNIVEMLVTVAGCMKNTVNKYGETPIDDICRRVDTGNRSRETIEMDSNIIRSLLADIYVPLYRPTDYSGSAVILKPMNHFPPVVFESQQQTDQQIYSYFSPSIIAEMRLAAVAGPFASESDANRFCKEWASSDPSIKRTDPHKGYERVGRSIATTYAVHWTEWWPFLNAFVDIATPGGLQLIDQYLQSIAIDPNEDGAESPWFAGRKMPIIDMNKCNSGDRSKTAPDDVGDRSKTTPDDGDMEFEDAESDINLLMMRQCSFENDDDDGDQFVTPPVTPPPHFVIGHDPSKLDNDLLLALVTANDQYPDLLRAYPHIRRYVKKMSDYSQTERADWPSLVSPRRSSRINNKKTRHLFKDD